MANNANQQYELTSSSTWDPNSIHRYDEFQEKIPPAYKRTFTDQKDDGVEFDTTERARSPSERSVRLSGVQTGWTPLILRTWTLLAFIVIYVLTFIALLALYFVSKRGHGLSTEKESRHYLWTYGPTAVFIVLAAFWRHLDYHLKLLMPWIELASGPKHAKLTVLLDYISPFQPVAFYHACKNRHWLVILSNIAFAFLKVATILATGLFVLQSTSLEFQSDQFHHVDQFSAKNFNVSAVDSRAAYTIFGIHGLNLTYPEGTSANAAYQSVESRNNATLAGIESVSMPVETFSGKLECENASLTWVNERDRSGYEITPLSQIYNTTATVPGCTLRKARLDAPSWIGNTTEQGYYGIMLNMQCSEIADPVEASRLLISINYSTRKNWTNTLERYSAVICKSSHSIQRSQVTVLGNNLRDFSKLSDVQSIGEPTVLPDFNSKLLSDSVFTTLKLSNHLAKGGWDATLDPWFNLLAASRPEIKPAEYMDPKLLAQASQELFASLTAQIAKLHLTTPAESQADVPVRLHQLVQRLLLREVSLIVMEIFVALLIISTVLILILLPKQGVIPRDMSSIGAIATILSRSYKIEQCLAGTSRLSPGQLVKWLHRYRFFSKVEHDEDGKRFKVEMLDLFPDSGHRQRFEENSHEAPEKESSLKWWKPIGMQLYTVAPLVLLPVIIIITLEVLYRKSERENGLTYLPTNGYVHYTWVYIPAFFMVLIITLFNMLDYAARSIAPYQVMRLDGAFASRGLLYNPTGKLALPALWYAVKERHITVIATTFAVLLAPLLTIAVSGLYFSELVGDNGTAVLHQTGWFNSTPNNYNPNSTADITAGLIVNANLTSPSWTYDSLVLARVGFADEEIASTIDSVFLDVPAIRGATNCSIVSQDRYVSIELGFGDGEKVSNQTGVPLFVNISFPDSCGNSGYEGRTETYLQMSLQRPETGYVGSLSQGVGSNPWCYSFSAFYGQFENNKLVNYTTALCSAHMEELSVATHFFMPNFTIDAISPPVPKEDTVRFFSNATLFPGRIFSSISVNGSSNDALDEFFTAAAYGNKGVPTSELIEPAKMVQRISDLYNIVIAQTFSEDVRITNPNPMTITATTRTRPRARLVQSLLSTRVLQVLLAFILLTTLVAYFGVKARELLPRESNSFATVAGYLAGSDVLKLVPPGAEWDTSEKADVNRRLFNGYVFGFGWWEDSERMGEKRYGVGIGRSQ